MDRDEFLGRVSAGLGRPCTPVDRPRATPPLDPPAGSLGTAPPSPDRDSDARDQEARLGLFMQRLEELGVTAEQVPERRAALAAIAETVAQERWSAVACPPGLRWDAIDHLWTDDPRSAPFGLSEADAAIAETGTLVLSHRGERGRGYSLVPPSVGFLLPASRLVPGLGDALARVVDDAIFPPSCVTFITGLSHSGDIAGSFCTGVHGPGDVRVWVITGE